MLNKIIYKRGYTVSSFSAKIGISEEVLTDKMNGSCEFKVGEVLKIIDILKLNHNEINYIFFK